MKIQVFGRQMSVNPIKAILQYLLEPLSEMPTESTLPGSIEGCIVSRITFAAGLSAPSESCEEDLQHGLPVCPTGMAVLG